MTVSGSFDFGAINEIGSLDASAEAAGLGELGDRKSLTELAGLDEAPHSQYENASQPATSKLPLCKAISSPEAAAFALEEEERRYDKESSRKQSPAHLSVDVDSGYSLGSSESLALSPTLNSSSGSALPSSKAHSSELSQGTGTAQKLGGANFSGPMSASSLKGLSIVASADDCVDASLDISEGTCASTANQSGFSVEDVHDNAGGGGSDRVGEPGTQEDCLSSQLPEQSSASFADGATVRVKVLQSTVIETNTTETLTDAVGQGQKNSSETSSETQAKTTKVSPAPPPTADAPTTPCDSYHRELAAAPAATTLVAVAPEAVMPPTSTSATTSDNQNKNNIGWEQEYHAYLVAKEAEECRQREPVKYEDDETETNLTETQTDLVAPTATKKTLTVTTQTALSSPSEISIALQEKCRALEDLLALAEKRHQNFSGGDDCLLRTWRNAAFEAIVLKNSALLRAENTEKKSHEMEQRLKAITEECEKKVKLGNARAKEADAIMKSEISKRSKVEKAAAADRKKAKDSQEALRRITSWALDFADGKENSRNPNSMTSSESSKELRFEKRGASIVKGIQLHNRTCEAKSREAALRTGCDLLSNYESRLQSMSRQLEFLSVHLAAKDSHLRNEQAAFAAEKAAWKKAGKASKVNDKTSGILSSSLSAESEAIMRSVFKRLEGRNGLGKVEICRLMRLLSTDDKLGRVMDYALGGESWTELLDALEKTLSRGDPNATVTWGEFLLCFIEGGMEELARYRSIGIPSPREIAIKSGDDVYSHSLLNVREAPHKRFQVAHLELVLPIVGNKVESESDLQSLDRLNERELRNMVRRLERERRLVSSPRVCVHVLVADVSFPSKLTLSSNTLSFPPIFSQVVHGRNASSMRPGTKSPSS